LTITYEPRAGDARALVVSLGLGGLIGLAIGGAYIVGGVARETVSKPLLAQANHVQIPAPAPGADQMAVNQAPQGPIAPNLYPATSSASNPASLRDRFSVALALTRSVVPPFHFQGSDGRADDDSRDTQCLAQAVYYEARGESPSGQAAVAQVVLNRVRHPAFPKTVCGVVFQHVGADCQFSFACNGSMREPLDRNAWRKAMVVAQRALSGAVMAEVGAATHFQAARSESGWAGGLAKVAQIGEHIFYRFSGRAGAPRMFRAEPQRSEPGAEAQADGSAARVHTVFKVATATAAESEAKPADPKATPLEPMATASAKPTDPSAKSPTASASQDLGLGAQPLKAVEAERSQPITTSSTPS
jgi:spore germination cell wall hydrolase CwlJ-like protein